MLTDIIEFLLKRESQLIIVGDLIVINLFLLYYQTFKLFYLMSTFICVAIFVYMLFIYLFELSEYLHALNTSASAITDANSFNIRKLEMADLIFRNDRLYRFVKRVILKIFYEYKLKKLDRLEKEAETCLEYDELILERLLQQRRREETIKTPQPPLAAATTPTLESSIFGVGVGVVCDSSQKTMDYIKVAQLQITRRKTYILNCQKKRAEIEAKTRKTNKNDPKTKEKMKLLKKINSSHHIHLFAKKFSAFFIDPWYLSFIGNDQEFILETQMQFESLFLDLFERVLRMDKLKFASQLAYLYKNNFLNIAINYSYNSDDGGRIPLEQLHPALRNSPDSEINYLKRFVQIALNKSASKLNIDQVIAEEFFMQVVGKNCLEKFINLVTKPSFVYYVISYLCEGEQTVEKFTSKSLKELRDKYYFKDTESRHQADDAATVNETNSSPSSIYFDLNSDSTTMGTTSVIDLKQKRDDSMSENDDNISMGNESIGNEQLTFTDWDKLINRFDVEIKSIKIPSTEIGYEAKTGNSFTLYTIQYEYKFTDLTATTTGASVKMADSGAAPTAAAIKVKYVKRRYKEFVLLQKRLEENLLMRNHLKNVRGPSKFLTLPFGNMDELYVEKRRMKLNEYLNQLISIPAICHTKELASFLSYEISNSSITSVAPNSYLEYEKSQNGSETGIIKVFSGVFDKISSTTASLNPLSSSTNKKQQQQQDDQNNNASANNAATNNSESFGDDLSHFQINSYQYTDYSSHDIIYAKYSRIKLEIDKRSIERKGSKLDKRNDETNCHLSKTLFEICNQLLKGSSIIHNMPSECWVNNRKINRFIESFFCDFYFEKFFEEFFQFLFSEDSLIEYLHDLEDVLFVDDDNQSKFIEDFSEFYDFAEKQLIDLFPKFFISIVGKLRFKGALKTFLDSIKIQLLNKHFAYCTFDLLLYTIYSDEFKNIS